MKALVIIVAVLFSSVSYAKSKGSDGSIQGSQIHVSNEAGKATGESCEFSKVAMTISPTEQPNEDGAANTSKKSGRR